MNRVIGGYTIIEVMIFMAISMVLFVSAVMAIHGQQARTEFATAMRDVESKMNSWITEVVAGFTGSTAGASASTFSCIPDPVDKSPLLKGSGIPSNNVRGANPDCIFVGKAVQLNTESGQNDKMTLYTVLGRRTYIDVLDNNTEKLVNNLSQANPAVAYNPTESIDLTSTYKLMNGMEIKGVKSGDPLSGLNPSLLAGFYLSFNTESNTSRNGSEALNLYQYPFSAKLPALDDNVLSCIKLKGACNSTDPLSPTLGWPLRNWQICFKSTGNSETATLTISSILGRGASVKMKYETC